MQRRSVSLAIALAAALATAACTDVKQTLDQASQGLDRLLNVDSGPAQTTVSPEAEALYREGLSAREKGAESDAFSRLLKAAELGHGPAAYEVGIAYKDGRGTAQDLEAGAKWINKAADQGEPRAQYLVGFAYYTGTGVKQDYEHAAGFLANAAVQGHAQAQYLFGQAFANGNGVAKNRARAARWYGKAAARGLVEAQFTYGVVHASGLGLPKNKTRGYAWLLLAARAGHKTADKVGHALAKKMTPKQLKWAKGRAGQFKPVDDSPFADPPTVMYVEHVLNGLGFDAGPVDGLEGKRTQTAIAKYQKKRGLRTDGKVSPRLLERLLDDQGKNS